MLDDTRTTSNAFPYSKSLSSEVVEIAKSSTDRKEALKRARNLRFLVYDDTEERKSGGLPKKQQCTRCAQRGNLNDIEKSALTMDDIHTCSEPFYNNHKLTRKEFNEHPCSYNCDVCNLMITFGNRYSCTLCPCDNSYDLCDDCVGSGKHCLDASHSLEKIAIFKYGDCIHVNARTCQICQDVPLFPNEGRVTKFKVVRFNREDIQAIEWTACDDFIAVSYCWPQSSSTTIEHNGKYIVQNEDGSLRSNRAPEEVLDRAVAFAAQNAIRLIWIDQECIDQNDPKDKEIYIQVMDKIYQRAYLSIGLLNNTVESSNTLDALKRLVRKEDNNAFEHFSAEGIDEADLVNELLVFLESIVHDPWHTRAWILQEAFSAGPRMCLLLPRNPNMVIPQLPGISRILSMTEIVIHMDTLLMIFDHSAHFLKHIDESTAIPPSLERRRAVILEKLQNFPPGDERSTKLKWSMPMGQSKPRRSCNAAVALSYLRSRDNTIISDRVAILANLCNYEIRLNIEEIEENHQYLGSCILTLALLNADFSILYPDVYDLPESIHQVVPNRTNTFSWMSISPSHFQHINVRSLDSFAYYLVPETANDHLSSAGLTFCGYLWKIKHKISIPELHEIMKPSDWSKLRFCAFLNHKVRNLGFSPDVVAAIKASRQYTTLSDDLKDFFAPLFAPGPTNDPDDLKILMEKRQRNILSGSIGNGAEQIDMISKSLFIRLLLLLRDKGEIHVANAIWDSIRYDRWDMGENPKHANTSYHNVRDFPRPGEDGTTEFPENFGTKIALDDDREGGYHQLWVIDRIMRTGCLWSGRLVRVSGEEEFTLDPDWKETTENVAANSEDTTFDSVDSVAPHSESLEVQYDPSPFKVSTKETDPIGRPLEDIDKDTTELTSNPDEVETANKARKSRDFLDTIDIQLFKQSITSPFISLINWWQDFSGETDSLPPGEMLPKAQSAARWYFGFLNRWKTEEHERIRNDLRAVFDVDGPDEGHIMGEGVITSGEQDSHSHRKSILVLTPYDPRSERLPHSEGRVMSMSWVVDTVDAEILTNSKGEMIQEVFKTKGMVKGMWRFLDEPPMEYRVI